MPCTQRRTSVAESGSLSCQPPTGWPRWRSTSVVSSVTGCSSTFAIASSSRSTCRSRVESMTGVSGRPAATRGGRLRDERGDPGDGAADRGDRAEHGHHQPAHQSNRLAVQVATNLHPQHAELLVDDRQPLVDEVEACVDMVEAAIELREAAIDLVEATVDLAEAT